MKSMPVSGQSLRSRESLWTRIHVDPWLLLLILALAAVDAFVLSSASGKNLGMVYRQLAYFAVGIAAMIVVAQFQCQRIGGATDLADLGGLQLA